MVNLRQYLLEECFAMVKHLSAYGKSIPPAAEGLLSCQSTDLKDSILTNAEIIQLHHILAQKIAPASPQTVKLLCVEAQKNKWLNFLGPVGLIRRLMATALLSLIAFIAISLTKQINVIDIEDSIYDEKGIKLLFVMIFYLSSASLGASFNNLFQANSYIQKNTYDPKYEASYWIRYVLGLIAGIMMAVVIPVPDSPQADKTSAALQFANASRPLLAMLGGFSASLIHRILFRLVFALESIFIGKQENETERKLAAAQLTNETEMENKKQVHINQLLRLEELCNQDKTSTDIKKEIDRYITQISS